MYVTLHPAIVHFPIALLLLGSVVALLRIYMPKRTDITICVGWLLFIGWIGSLAAILSGLLAQSDLPPRAPYRSVLNQHISAGIATAVTYGIILYLWWLRRPRQEDGGRRSPHLLDDPKIRIWLTILLLLGMFFVAASGWNGGQLVYEWGVNAG